jgi:hypothetical protein
MVERNRLIRTMSQVNLNFQTTRQEIMDERPNFDQIKDSRHLTLWKKSQKTKYYLLVKIQWD